MKQLVAIYTEHRFCRAGVSLWGNGGEDKIATIAYYTPGYAVPVVHGDGYLVTTTSGREIFVKAEHVIAVEYQEVADGQAGTT